MVCEGTPEPLRPAVVIGPGTGLGVGTLLDLGAGRYAALPGEGGHVDLPLSSPRETQLWQHIHNEIGHVSAETALSGGGLPRLYRAICAVDGHAPVLDTPEAITAAGLAGDPVAMEVLDQFSIWLGRVAGNNVLTTGGRGGVYIVGGVIPQVCRLLYQQWFRQKLQRQRLHERLLQRHSGVVGDRAVFRVDRGGCGARAGFCLGRDGPIGGKPAPTFETRSNAEGLPPMGLKNMPITTRRTP